MNRWRAEYDDGIWLFYRDGMELGLYEKGDVVIDALNNAESRIAELEAEKEIMKDQQREAKNILIDKNLHIDSLYEEGYKLQQRIAELEEKQRWIPVSERLPDTKIVYDKFDVIVEFEDIENGVMTRCVELLSYDYRNKSWNDDCWEFGFYPVAGVTHWRERPTLPEVQE